MSLSSLRYFLKILFGFPQGGKVLVGSLLGRKISKLKLPGGYIAQGGKKSVLLSIAEEIFIDRKYTPDFLPLDPEETVIDIGGNIGLFSLYAVGCGANKVFCYEPLPENVEIIKRNLRENGICSVVVEPMAVTDKKGSPRLYLTDKDSGNLVFSFNSQGKLSRYLMVESISLKEILGRHKLKKVDFLKIDCEGGEGLIVRSTPDAVWRKIRKISLEYHDNVSPLHHKEIAARFLKMGFEVSCRAESSCFGYLYAWQKFPVA